MPVQAPLEKSSGETLSASDLTELQVRLRRGVREHVHGVESALLSADLIRAGEHVRARVVASDAATLAGRDLGELLDQATRPRGEHSGALTVAADLSLGGAPSVRGAVQTPRVLSARETYTNGSLSYDDPAPPSSADAARWRVVRGLSLDFELTAARTVLLSTMFVSQPEFLARHALVIAGKRVPAAALVPRQDPVRSPEELRKWAETSPSYAALWGEGTLMKGGLLLEAVSLPKGAYTVQTEVHWWSGIDLGSHATLTIAQL